jgi:hypothetical protein
MARLAAGALFRATGHRARLASSRLSSLLDVEESSPHWLLSRQDITLYARRLILLLIDPKPSTSAAQFTDAVQCPLVIAQRSGRDFARIDFSVGTGGAHHATAARVALCGTFSGSRVLLCHEETWIRSPIHVLRRRALALPTTLNLLVEGSIPSGLTKLFPNQ